jgi:hypothetical protein
MKGQLTKVLVGILQVNSLQSDLGTNDHKN